MALTQTEKARGAVYTPTPITRFLARWAIRSADDVVLEPAAGDGAFLTAAAQRLNELGGDQPAGRIIAVELDPSEARAARRAAPNARVLTGDFLAIRKSRTGPVTAVLGNPPYIRYQAFPAESRNNGHARVREMGVELSRLSSSWAHFVIHAWSFLEANGRLALVLPAELLTAQYAEPVWTFLESKFRAVSIIAFDDPVFHGVQVDAVLLVADDGEPPEQRVLTLSSIESLDSLPDGWRASASRVANRRAARVVNAEVMEVYETLAELTIPLGSLASVDIGVVTGANQYFVKSHGEWAHIDVPRRYTTKIIERSRHVGGLRIRPGEAKRLLLATELAAAEHDGLREYLDSDDAAAVQKGYKCSHRTPWHLVPLPRSEPDALMPYMVHDAPRLIVADGHWSTNLLHGVTITADVSPEALAVAMMSSATQLSMEIEGRTYGGGVLKLEPSEAERVRVPSITPETATVLEEIFSEVDAAVHHGDRAAAVRLVDELLGVDHERTAAALVLQRARRLALGRAGRPAPAPRGKRRERRRRETPVLARPEDPADGALEAAHDR